MHRKYLIPFASWSALGFYRGVQIYTETKSPHYKFLYTDWFVCGLGGVFLYSVPPFMLVGMRYVN